MRFILLALLLALSSVANAVEYKAMTVQDLDKIIDQKEEVRLLYFFASWCSACKKNYNEVLRLENKYKGENLKVVAIALDESVPTLRSFINTHKDQNSTVYHLAYSDGQELKSFFRKYGIRYRGGIPHVTLLDEKGKIIADGTYDLSYFDKGLDRLLK